MVNINKCTATIKQFFELYNEYTSKFGAKTVILMCIGSFYECYQIGDFGTAINLHEMFGLQYTRKNKTKEENEQNPSLVGFHESAIDKYLPRLLEAGWNVVRVDQFDKEFSDEKDRKVTKIYSASTYIENETQFNNYLIGIDYEIIKDKKFIYFVALDLSTGSCKCVNLFDTQTDPDGSLNTFERFIYSFTASEILIRTPKNINEESFLGSILSFVKSIPIHKYILNKEYTKVDYQQQFMTKVFSTDDIGLYHFPELQSLIITTVQFAYDHDNTLINKLSLPELMLDDTDILNLNNDAIAQLNLISSNDGNGSLFDTIDFTSTNMGKRLLKERILRPTCNIEELNKRYKLITDIIESKEYTKLKKILNNIADLEKKHRKASIGKLSPKEFAEIQSSYSSIIELLEHNTVEQITNENVLKKQSVSTILQKFKKYIEKCNTMFEFDKMDKMVVITNNFFKNGVYDEIDELQTKIDVLVSKLNSIGESITETIGIKDCIKVMCAESGDYYFSTTPKRALNLKKDSMYTIVNLKSVAKITTKESDSISNELKHLNKKLLKLVNTKFTEFLIDIMYKYKNLLKLIVKIVSIIDVSVSGSICATKFAYHCPTISNTVGNNKSYIKCECVRQPIIERIIKTEYVGNDLSIGIDTDVLLYGLNSSGKSSLLRSIGCNLVLAQAGLFVASTKFEFYPYKDMMCKFSCKDNLFKSQSTFISELEEVKNILIKGGKNSIVLGDELCNGTESSSASALVASTIEELIESQTTFMISTHLHEILKFDAINTNKNVQICRMQVNITSGNIEYTRKLTNGSGDELYGVEVAGTVGLPAKFMKRAYEFRNILEKRNTEILSTKKSRYNPKVYMDKCNRCGSTENLCTHHINEQHLSDENGIIDAKFHKNEYFNLEVLCDKCHKQHHNHPLN